MKVESSTIQNKYLRVQTLNYGASLFEVYHKKKKINLILNLGSKQNYRYKHPSVGSTCGRYAGRISNAKFKIGNKKYNLKPEQITYLGPRCIDKDEINIIKENRIKLYTSEQLKQNRTVNRIRRKLNKFNNY